MPVGSLLRRLAWAITMSDGGQILFSQSVKPESRMVFRRHIRERVEALAPFLTFDSDPYPVLVNGRIKWVIDAYTTSGYFPYSEPLPGGDVNYLRNSVKVVIDAFDGTTTLYAFDPSDPVLRAWADIYPGLFTPGTQIPAEIRDHFRYPSDQFSAQAEIYRNYHMTDPRVFYNKEDSWAIPNQSTGDPIEPFFVLMRLPGESQEHFYLMQPYTPRNRSNMIGWVAANSDPEKYGERTVFLFPKERVVLGPEQVLARVNQDPEDLAAAVAVEPAREPGDLRQHARDPDQELDRLHHAALSPSRADRHPSAHPSDRVLLRQGRDGGRLSRRRCSRSSAPSNPPLAADGRLDRGRPAPRAVPVVALSRRRRDGPRSCTSRPFRRSAPATGRPTARGSRSSAACSISSPAGDDRDAVAGRRAKPRRSAAESK